MAVRPLFHLLPVGASGPSETVTRRAAVLVRTVGWIFQPDPHRPAWLLGLWET